MKTIVTILLLLAATGAPLVRGADKVSKPAAPATAPKGFKNVGVEEFDKLRADKNNVILDVRTAKEFAAGHIPGAINLDWNSGDFAKAVATLDKNKTYLVHCAAGGRSAKACEKMGQLQFKNAINLEGGFKEWEKAGKAVEKK